MSLPLPDGLRPGGRFAEWRPAAPEYVVADVDGTLVGRGGVASEAVVAACRGATVDGLPVGFATGRMRLAVASLWDQLRLPGPHVLHNGAEVRADGETVAAWSLTDRQLGEIFRIAGELDVYVELYSPDGYAVSRLDERARPHWDLLGVPPTGVVASPTDVEGPTLKATFGLFDGDDVGAVVTALRDVGLAAGPAGSPVTPTIIYVNATDATVDKGAALCAAAAHLDVPIASVVAVGDAHNDLPLLQAAGTAIAMGQADAEVAAAAHLIAPTVDDDGVATALAAALTWRRA